MECDDPVALQAMDSSPLSPVADRTRFLACAMALVCLAGWVGWFWPFDDLLDRQGTPLGADFSMFFTAGQIASEGVFEKLYDQGEHQRRLHESFPGLSAQFCLPFRYPPAVALGMAPLSRLPYAVAWGVFSLGSCAAFAGSLYLLCNLVGGVSGSRSSGRGESLLTARQEPRPPEARSPEARSPEARSPEAPSWISTAIWACAGWPVAWEVLMGGQASMLALAIAVATILLITKDRIILAGAVLALSAYKPNVLAWFVVGIAVRHPRVLIGAIPVLGAFAGVSCLAGRQRLAEYAQLTLNLTSGTWDVETPFWKAHSFAPCLESVFPGHGRVATILLGFLAATVIALVWRCRDANKSTSAQTFSMAALLLVNALLNPYTPIYDLVLMAPAGWLVAKGFYSSTATEISGVSATFAQCWLAVLFFGPHLSQALARQLGLQLFPFALAAIGISVLFSTQMVVRRVGGNRLANATAG